MSTVFEGGTTEPTKQEDNGLLSALVGDNQKYKSVEELAKAYVSADEFIEKLKDENKKLREQAQSSTTLDDILNRLNETSKEKQADPVSKTAVDETAVAALVEKTVSDLTEKKSKEHNLLEADRLMKEKFGEKAAEVYNKKATSPALKKVFMELAAADPKEFMKQFAENTMASTGVGEPATNTSAIMAQTGGEPAEWSKAWAAKIRKEKPDVYYSSDFQWKLQDTVTKNPKLYFGE